MPCCSQPSGFRPQKVAETPQACQKSKLMPGMFDREYQSTPWHHVPITGRPGHMREFPHPAGASGLLARPVYAYCGPKHGRMGTRPASERPPHERPQRDRKAPLKFSPDTQTGTEAGENAYLGWRNKFKGPDYGGTPASPPQRPMQDQSNAGDSNSHSGTFGALATVLLLHLCGKNVPDEAGPGDAGGYVLDTQASQPDGGTEPWTQALACAVTPKGTDTQNVVLQYHPRHICSAPVHNARFTRWLSS